MYIIHLPFSSPLFLLSSQGSKLCFSLFVATQEHNPQEEQKSIFSFCSFLCAPTQKSPNHQKDAHFFDINISNEGAVTLSGRTIPDYPKILKKRRCFLMRTYFLLCATPHHVSHLRFFCYFFSFSRCFQDRRFQKPGDREIYTHTHTNHMWCLYIITQVFTPKHFFDQQRSTFVFLLFCDFFEPHIFRFPGRRERKYNIFCHMFFEDCQFTRRYFGNRGYFLFTPLSDMLKFGGQFRQTFLVFCLFFFCRFPFGRHRLNQRELFAFFRFSPLFCVCWRFFVGEREVVCHHPHTTLNQKQNKPPPHTQLLTHFVCFFLVFRLHNNTRERPQHKGRQNPIFIYIYILSSSKPSSTFLLGFCFFVSFFLSCFLPRFFLFFLVFPLFCLFFWRRRNERSSIGFFSSFLAGGGNPQSKQQKPEEEHANEQQPSEKEREGRRGRKERRRERENRKLSLSLSLAFSFFSPTFAFFRFCFP